MSENTWVRRNSFRMRNLNHFEKTLFRDWHSDMKKGIGKDIGWVWRQKQPTKIQYIQKQRTNSKVFFKHNFGYDLNLQQRRFNHAPKIRKMKYKQLKSLKGLNYRSKLVKRMKGRLESLKATASWQGRSDSSHPVSSSWRESSDSVHPAPSFWQDRPASIRPATTSWQHNSDSVHPDPSSWPGAGEVPMPLV
jgi:hypothetical protein